MALSHTDRDLPGRGGTGSHRQRLTWKGWHWVTQAETYLEGVALSHTDRDLPGRGGTGSLRQRLTWNGWHWVTQAETYLEGVALGHQGNICCSVIHIDICFSSVFASQRPTYTTSM